MSRRGRESATTALAEARDALWLAKRAVEENNAVQARSNLEAARLRLKVYREVLPEDRRSEVDRLMGEVEQLEGKLHRGSTRPASQAERSGWGDMMARWWDQVNDWFRRTF